MRSIRKRGVHRALKRGEPWAVVDANIAKLVNSLHDLYGKLYIGDPGELLGLSEWFPNKTIPIVYQEPFFGLDRTPPLVLRPNMKIPWLSRIKSWFQSLYT